MIKLKVKMVNDDTLKICNYKIKNSNSIEHLSLICFLIDEIVEHSDKTQEEIIELVKDLLKEEE